MTIRPVEPDSVHGCTTYAKSLRTHTFWQVGIVSKPRPLHDLLLKLKTLLVEHLQQKQQKIAKGHGITVAAWALSGLTQSEISAVAQLRDGQAVEGKKHGR